MFHPHRIASILKAVLVVMVVLGMQLQAQPNPYHRVEDWLKLPGGRKLGSTGAVYPAPDGNMWIADRCGDNDCVGKDDIAPILLISPSGTLLKSFGAGMFAWPHGIFVDGEGNLWVTDGREGGGKGQQVFKFSPDGKVLMTLGTKGVTGKGPYVFDGPSDVVVAANGDIFVVDGHGKKNCRIVKYSSNGQFIKAWGQKGSGPGEFEDPHGISIDSQGRLFVADRDNRRIQIFDQEGNFLDQWKQFGRPSGVYIAADDTIYVADSEPGTVLHPGRTEGIRIGSARDGSITALIPTPEPPPGVEGHITAEGVAADAKGNVYAADIGLGNVRKYARR